MPRHRILFRAFGVLILTINLRAASGSLRVTVVDAFGGPVSGSHVTLTDPAGRSFEAVNGFLAKLPPGSYSLTIESIGFRRLVKPIAVPPRPMHLKVGLLLAVIGDPEVEGTSLNGHVRNCPSKTQSWVRLSGLYAEVMFQARIAQDCSFSFTGLSGGEFLAYVIAHGRVVTAKQVKIVGQNPPLILEPAALPLR